MIEKIVNGVKYNLILYKNKGQDTFEIREVVENIILEGAVEKKEDLLNLQDIFTAEDIQEIEILPF